MFIGEYNNYPLSLAKDVLAHEFTHGVISYTSDFANVPKNLNTANESGALNEGYADVLGSLIENKNWVIGESIKDIIRDLTNPESLKKPSQKEGEYWFPTHYLKNRSLEELLKANGFETLHDYDQGGVHDNANVVGHASYLMEQYEAFSSHEQMAKVWYNSLFLLSSYSDFEDAAYALIKTAKNLGLDKVNVGKVKQALSDTRMLDEKYYVYGGVIKDKDEVALDNVDIVLINDDTKEKYYLKTNPDGTFKFYGLEEGKYIITYSKNDYLPKEQTIFINGNTEEIEVVLENGKIVSFEGLVKSNNKVLSNVKINLENLDNNQKYEAITNKDGKFVIDKVQTGRYKLVVNKDNYQTVNREINIVQIENNYEINLIRAIDNSVCKDAKYDCIVFTMDILQADKNGKLKEVQQSYPVKVGSILANDKTIKNVLGSIVESDGDNFFFKMGNLKMDVAWYYKDTDKKFAWDKPIYENTEVEMKILDGLFDNDFFTDVSGLISK